MRNGSAAIVPLFIGIMLLFWAIMFLGSSGDTLHSVNKVENLSHLQTKLLLPALKHYDEQRKAGKTPEAASASANAYVNEMMKLNKIQE